MSHPIRLNSNELRAAAYVGIDRVVQSIIKVREGTWDNDTDEPDAECFKRNIDGAQGEIAVARFLGLYWRPSVGTIKAPDVAGYQVKTSRYPNMLVRKKDKDEDIFIGVQLIPPDDFLIHGWITGKEAREVGRKGGDPNRPPCVLVAPEHLHDMASLRPK